MNKLKDISMECIRKEIDKACENGKRYILIENTGIESVDDSIMLAMDCYGYKVSTNGEEIIIEW